MEQMNYTAAIAANILAMRKKSGLTQEELADKLGISFQAVSKWENGQSCPDITLLPTLAEIFGVSIGELYGINAQTQTSSSAEPEPQTTPDQPPSANSAQHASHAPWPDDNTLRIVVFKGWELLDASENLSSYTFTLDGDALDVDCRCNLNCGNINGSANAGASINCDGVYGSVNAGGHVTCGNVEGNVGAGGNITCGNIEGSADSGGSINCNNIEGDAEAGASIECDRIEGDAQAGVSIKCSTIGGDMHSAMGGNSRGKGFPFRFGGHGE